MTRISKQIRPQRFCIFCGASGLTKEHIFAKWLQPDLPRFDESKYYSRSIIHNLDRSKVRQKKIEGEPHSGTLKVVCAACNNGWMSRLQSDVKAILLPMVQGKSTSLYVRQCRILSAWAAMFVMVAERRQNETLSVATSYESRQHLKDTQTAPKGWRIWISSFERKRWEPLIVHSTAEISVATHDGSLSNERSISPNTHATTFVIGEIFFHIFASTIRRAVRNQEPGHELRQIHPVEDTPVLYPPALKLSDHDADDIAFAFQRRLNAIVKNSRGRG